MATLAESSQGEFIAAILKVLSSNGMKFCSFEFVSVFSWVQTCKIIFMKHFYDINLLTLLILILIQPQYIKSN